MARPLLLAILREGAVTAVQEVGEPDGTTATPTSVSGSLDPDPRSALPALARAAPGGLVGWVEEDVLAHLGPPARWEGLLRHDLEILHLGRVFRTSEDARELGLVDWSSPFLLPGPSDRRFPTWLASPACGVTSAGVLDRIGLDPAAPSLFAAFLDFGHRAQTAGAFCYHEPGLLSDGGESVGRAECVPPDIVASHRGRLSNSDCAWLVRRLRDRRWLPFWALGRLLAGRWPAPVAVTREWVCGGEASSVCQAPADALQDLRPPLDAPGGAEPSVHAIIPTYGRSRYVASLLSDLADQTLVPKGVFVIHQERREGDDDLDELREALASREWPYEVELLLSERVGACRARNLGLGRVDAEWILLLDDDVRLRPRFVEHLHRVARAYGIEAVVGAVHLEEEADQLPQDFVMPWSTFGTGTSMVSREVAERAGPFDETLETGWGEDFEWGVRLRLSGGSVGYTTGEPTLHLKAPSGGFRSLPSHPWEEDRGVRPRPSPTMVHSRYKHATPEMRTGFRLYSWLAQLRERPPWWWPVEGIRALRRVRSAERWARRLQSGSGEGR